MQQPGDAFVQKPDEMGAPEDMVFCWRDPERPCGGDCVAFDPVGADPATPRSTCILVNAARQGVSALVTLARSISVTGADQPAPRVRT